MTATKQQLTVVKIGGHVIDKEEELLSFLEVFSRLEGPRILVHGGGKMATELATKMNLPQQLVEGRRITDEATLKVVTMVYAGYINKHITALLQGRNCAAIGLCGVDGNLLKAHKREQAAINYGFAGDVDEVNVDLLGAILDDGLCPVIAPITHDGKGQLLNTNADTIAQEIAQAMSATFDTRLVYCFEQEGVLSDVKDSTSVISVLYVEEVSDLISSGVIAGGMIPKIHNALAALDLGVKEVIIGKSDRLADMLLHGAGTKIKYA